MIDLPHGMPQGDKVKEWFWFGSVDDRGELMILGNLFGYETEAELRRHNDMAIEMDAEYGRPSYIFRAKKEVLKP